MLRSDYLDPESLKMQCDGAIRRLERDNKALSAVWKSLESFSEDEEIESESFKALRRQLKDYRIIIEGMSIANNSDIKDFQSLSSLAGDELLDGETIFCQMENAQGAKERYQLKAELSREKMLSAAEPFSCLYYTVKMEKYGALADSSQRLYEKWAAKAERFDEIVSDTSGLFTGSEGVSIYVKEGLTGIEKAFRDGVYMPDTENGWRNQIKNAAIRLAMCFDDCGGRQAGPGNAWWTGTEDERKLIRELVHSYEEYKDYSDEEITELLTKLNSEGCGYVAFVNIIADEYRGKEEEFEKIFGFPLFRVNAAGTVYVNYNQLIMDLYCSSDNHNEEGVLWEKHDRYDSEEDISKTEGAGTTREKRAYRFERYMKAHGIEVEMENIECSTQEVYKKCKEETEKGRRIIIGTHPVRLEDKKGSSVQSDGGHAMTVTGLTDDGKIEVSSWGKKYYITPEDSEYRDTCPEKVCEQDAYIQIQSVRFR